jgi:predicted peroxiredoxin
MPEKVLVNLSSGLEDPERVMIAHLVATAALERGAQVAIWCTKEAVRLGVPGHATGVACEGCPPLERLVAQFADGGGELLLCPICLKAKGIPEEFVPNARTCGATPMLEWLDGGGQVFSF